MKSFKAFVVKALATCGYLSYIPSWIHQAVRHGKRREGATGAGLIGSVCGLLCARWLPTTVISTLAVLLGGLAVTIAVSDAAEELMERVDDPRIVIDEWIGYLVGVALLPHTWIVWIVGLVLFRLFDVFKPLGIRTCGDLPGGVGVVMDDVAAGVYVNLILQLAHRFHWL